MTDDEAQRWLTDEERAAWRIEIDANIFVDNRKILWKALE